MATTATFGLTRDRAQNHGQCQCLRGRTWTCEPLPRLPVDHDNDQSEDMPDCNSRYCGRFPFVTFAAHYRL